jgi:hypothetical protein
MHVNTYITYIPIHTRRERERGRERELDRDRDIDIDVVNLAIKKLRKHIQR